MAKNDQNDQSTTKVGQVPELPSHAGGKVYVACKVPAGLQLRCFSMTQKVEATPRGPIPFDIAQQDGPSIYLHGPAVPRTMDGQNAQVNYRIVGGYAITVINASDWERWFKDNSKSKLIKNHQLMAMNTEEDIVGWCKEHSQVTSGLAPLMQDGDPRNKSIVMQGIKDLKRDTDRPFRS